MKKVQENLQDTRNPLNLSLSVRGKYIMDQALAIAARVMRAGNPPWKEESNAMDCELLGKLYQPFYSMEYVSERPILGEENKQ